MKDEKVLQADTNKDMVVAEEKAVGVYEGPARGFDDDDNEDVIIPRIKVIQDLSPERKEKIANEGDLLNSLTKEIINGKSFVPVFKYMNNIKWKDRSLGGGIECIAKDGKTGQQLDGVCKNCAECGLNKFDNTKQGKDAAPACTAYFNFFGFIEGIHVPIILSFCKTYYNEGKKMYSMAKFRMADMWNFKYKIASNKKSKNENQWYIITASADGPTTAEDRAFAEQLYSMFRNSDIKADLESYDTDATSSSTVEVDADLGSEY